MPEKPKFKASKKKVIPVSERKFGIELEMIGDDDDIVAAVRAAGAQCENEGYHHVARRHWKVVTDSSLCYEGYELVSPILSGEAGTDEIVQVCRSLTRAGMKIKRTCGYHVHHDAAQLDLAEWKAFFKRWVVFESLIDLMLPRSRRSNGACKSVRRVVEGHARYTTQTRQPRNVNIINGAVCLADLMNEIERCSDLRAISEVVNDGGDRYHKVNLQSFWRYQTVEIRCHSGTIDPDKVVNWIVLTQALIEDSVLRPYLHLRHTGETLDSLFQCLPATTHRKAVADFYRHRIAQLNGQCP